MVSKSNVMGWLAILSGMLFFKSTTYIEWFENYISRYPLIFAGLALALFFFRGQIAEKIGAK